LAFLAQGVEITILTDAVIVGGVETLRGDNKDKEDTTIALGLSAKHHRFIKDPKDISPSSINGIPALNHFLFVSQGQYISSVSFARVLSVRYLRQ
jgi:hypothetical protein